MGEVEEHDCHAQPFAASAAKTHGETGHAEALPIVSARRSIEGMKTMPHPGAHPTARPTTPKCRERRSRRCLPKPMRKRAHVEALPICFFFGGGRHSIGGMTNQASPRSATNHHAHDPQVTGVPLAASFAQPHEETGPRGSAAIFCFWGARVPSGGRPTKPPPGASPTSVPPRGRESRLQRCLYIPPRDPW